MENEPDGMLLESYWRTLHAVSEWIRFADAKAGATLAIDGVLLAIVTARLQAPPTPPTLVSVGSLAAIAVAAASALFALWTVIPRAKKLRTISIVHYGTIARFGTYAEYHKAATAAFTEDGRSAKELAAYSWALSRSAARKYQLVTIAIQLLVVAMALALASMLVR